MSGLLRAEIRRLTSRRLARLVALIFLGVLLLTQVISGVQHNKDLEGARRKAIAEAAQAVADQQSGKARAECERMQEGEEIPEGIDCANFVGFRSTNPDDYYSDPRMIGREVLPAMATGLTVAMMMVGFIVGTSSIGAEWHAGTLQALLFWEPRRGRVLLAKGLALVAVMVAFTAVVQLIGWSTTLLLSSTRGTTEGVTGGLHMSVFLAMLRGFFLVSFTSLLAFAIAGLTRVTAAALGAGFLYFAILENLLRVLRPGWTRFLISPNMGAVLEKEIEVPPASRTRGFEEGFFEPQYLLTGVRGAVTLGIYLVLFLGALHVWFSRRDVT